MRVLRITAAQSYMVNGVRIWHQFSDTKHGWYHRLAVNGIAADWEGYSHIALFLQGRRTFAATSEFYGETLPRVFEITKGVADV